MGTSVPGPDTRIRFAAGERPDHACGTLLARHLTVSVLADLRYSARGLARTPAITLALLLTIALGIGSNAAMHGFVRGLLARELPLEGIDSVVALFARAGERLAGPISYEDYRSLENHRETFEWVGVAHEAHDTIVVADRPVILSVAAVTPDLAALFDLRLDDGVVVSHRTWEVEFGAEKEIGRERIRIGDVDARVAAIAPEWLEGLYAGRAVDLWVPLTQEHLQHLDRNSRIFWAFGRLRPGVSTRQAQAAVDVLSNGATAIGMLPYTGVTPEMADGTGRIGTLLRAAAGAVFFIACANVASFLLARTSARSHETSVRVALGAGRRQLARQLLSDSVLISVIGGAFGALLAMWTIRVIPALFFDQDAEHLIFAPDRSSIIGASAVCVGITIACGLLPLLEIRHDAPASVLRREGTGPSNAMRRLRAGLVVMQMTCCCLLVISAGLLLQAFRSALQTSMGQRLGRPILATLEAQPDSISRYETANRGLKYFRDAERAAASLPGITTTAWTAAIPGGLPAWQSMRIEPARLPFKEVTMDVSAFTARSLAFVKVPPVAGRLFSGADTPDACRVVLVNETAAAIFGDDAVGRAIEGPAGERVEIVGVVAVRRENRAVTDRPTIYYYADQTAARDERAGPARFRVPMQSQPATGLFATNIVSRGYFAAMGLSTLAGRVFADDPAPRSCRVAVVNEEAADRYFGGNAVGAAVVDNAGRRTEIVGVVRASRLHTFQRGEEPTLYIPMAQQYLRRMTLILSARDTDDAMVASVRRQVEPVAGGVPARAVFTTLDRHLGRTALAPLRIATTLVGAFAATALTLGGLGLYGAMTDAARRRRRDIAVRLALGAQGWRVIRQLVAEGVRLAGAGTVIGMLGALAIAERLARITPSAASPALWVWIAAPLMLTGAVAIASVLPARRTVRLDPLTVMRNAD